jgi:hypothetical protein
MDLTRKNQGLSYTTARDTDCASCSGTINTIATAEIRSSRLYREDYSTFEAFCAVGFDIHGQRCGMRMVQEREASKRLVPINY